MYFKVLFQRHHKRIFIGYLSKYTLLYLHRDTQHQTPRKKEKSKVVNFDNYSTLAKKDTARQYPSLPPQHVNRQS